VIPHGQGSKAGLFGLPRQAHHRIAERPLKGVGEREANSYSHICPPDGCGSIGQGLLTL
jgi:hypothetical protein